MRRKVLIAALMAIQLLLFIGPSVAGEIYYGKEIDDTLDLLDGAIVGEVLVNAELKYYIVYKPSESENVEKVEFNLNDLYYYTAYGTTLDDGTTIYIFNDDVFDFSLLNINGFVHTVTANVYFEGESEYSTYEANFSRVGYVRFSMISDSHICAAGNFFGDHCNTQNKHDDRRAGLANAGSGIFAGSEFVVSLGDHIEDLYYLWPFSPIDDYFFLVNEYFDKDMRHIMVLGNHDVRSYSDTVMREYAKEQFRFYETKYNNNNGNYNFQFIEDKALYHDNGWRFFFLNSTAAADTAAKGSCVKLSQEQLDWLDEQLGDFYTKTALLFWHQDPRKELDGVNEDLCNVRQPGELDDYIDVLSKHRTKIKAVFAGHTHSFKRYKWDASSTEAHPVTDLYDGFFNYEVEEDEILFFSVASTGLTEGEYDDLWLDVLLRPDGLHLFNDALGSVIWNKVGGPEIDDDTIEVETQIDEGTEVSVSVTFNELVPGTWYGYSFDWKHIDTGEIVYTFSQAFSLHEDDTDTTATLTNSYIFPDDHPTSDTAEDLFHVEIKIWDATGYGDSGTSPEILVSNLDPEIDSISLSATSINEADPAVVVSGTFSDPAYGKSTESFTGTAVWSDGETTSLTITEKSFETTRGFPDDHPATGTVADDFTVEITIADDDTGSGTAASPTLTVNNVDPTVTVDAVTQENIPFLLPLANTNFTGNFTDPGWPDTHTGLWDFGDNTGIEGVVDEENDAPDSTGAVTAEHVYAAPGDYKVALTVTDDDGGPGTGEMPIRVLTAQEAAQTINDFIQDCPDGVFLRNPEQMKNALSEKFDELIGLINDGEYLDAMDKLNSDIRAKADGLITDWIIDEGTQKTICSTIDALVSYLQKLL